MSGGIRNRSPIKVVERIKVNFGCLKAEVLSSAEFWRQPHLLSRM